MLKQMLKSVRFRQREGYDFLRKNWNGFLSLLYPSNCEICSNETTELSPLICFGCESELNYTFYENYEDSSPCDEIFWGRIKLQRAYSMLIFKNRNSTQKLLHAIKYKNAKDLTIDFGERMGRRLVGTEYLSTVDAIVPIPLHTKKEFTRGYNQSQLICEGLNNISQIPIVPLIQRKRHHESQTKKDRFQRWENVADIFATNSEINSDYRHVVLVDDVLTTGATLESAARTLMDELPGIKVSIFTIALAK
jgi:competence protein ComFC